MFISTLFTGNVCFDINDRINAKEPQENLHAVLGTFKSEESNYTHSH